MTRTTSKESTRYTSVFDITEKYNSLRETEKTLVSRQNRVLYYLGSLNSISIKKLTHAAVMEYSKRLKQIHYDESTGILDKYLRETYEDPLKMAIGLCRKQPRGVDYHIGDVGPGLVLHNTTLTKCRYKSNSGVIVYSMDCDRHWENFTTNDDTIPYTEKESLCVFRGASTGLHTNGLRFKLMESFFDKKHFDVGFSPVTPDALNFIKYEKPHITVSDFYKFKFLLSLPGNDNDAGLSWKLNSNSVVLMPPPLTQSWLMENTLIPNYHYVPIAGDLSNLNDQLNWCMNNPGQCEKISRNASTYMWQFKDVGYQYNIQTDVLKKYMDKISIIKTYAMQMQQTINELTCNLTGY